MPVTVVAVLVEAVPSLRSDPPSDAWRWVRVGAYGLTLLHGTGTFVLHETFNGVARAALADGLAWCRGGGVDRYVRSTHVVSESV